MDLRYSAELASSVLSRLLNWLGRPRTRQHQAVQGPRTSSSAARWFGFGSRGEVEGIIATRKSIWHARPGCSGYRSAVCRSCRRARVALVGDPVLAVHPEQPLPPMPTLASIQSVDELANLLGSTPEGLALLIRLRTGQYNGFYLKKRHGGQSRRLVYRIEPEMRGIQRTIALLIEGSWTAPVCVHGFVRRRSIVTNAKTHLAKPVVVTADIENFFANISEDSVRMVLGRLGAVREVAEILAKLSTYMGTLPAGSRCSAIIANVVLAPIDAIFADRYPNYTRYADDFAFSGNTQDVPTEAEIEQVVSQFGFCVRSGSFFKMVHPRTQYVTGLVVNHRAGPHANRSVKRRIRTDLHYITKFGIDQHCEMTGELVGKAIPRILGTFHFLLMVEPRFAERLLADLPEEDELNNVVCVGGDSATKRTLAP